MASSPLEVTHGFTLSAPHWAWLILKGHKIIENRQVRFTPGWYAVHIGATAHTSVVEELEYNKEFGMPSVMGMPRGHVVGLCLIETGVPHEQCKKNRWAVKEFKICNIITKVIPFDGKDSAKARGNFGTWPLKESEKPVRELAKQAIQFGHLKKTNAKEVFGHLLDLPGKEAPIVKAKRPAEEAPKAEAASSPAIKKAKRETVSDPKPAKEGVAVTTDKADKADIRGFFFKKVAT